jgi:hypothetical protein
MKHIKLASKKPVKAQTNPLDIVKCLITALIEGADPFACFKTDVA